MLRRIIICIFLGVISVAGVILQYSIRHPEEKVFTSTGVTIFLLFSCLLYAFVFFVIWVSFFLGKKTNNNAKEDEKNTDDDGFGKNNYNYPIAKGEVQDIEDAGDGLDFHKQGDHCMGCPASTKRIKDNEECTEEPHCPKCPQNKVAHLV